MFHTAPDNSKSVPLCLIPRKAHHEPPPAFASCSAHTTERVPRVKARDEDESQRARERESERAREPEMRTMESSLLISLLLRALVRRYFRWLFFFVFLLCAFIFSTPSLQFVTPAPNFFSPAQQQLDLRRNLAASKNTSRKHQRDCFAGVISRCLK